MRCMPHAVFNAGLESAKKYYELKRLITGESCFVHSNPIVHEAILVYVVSLAHLFNNPNDPQRAQTAFNLALDLSKDSIANTVDQQYGESVNKWL